MTHYMVVSPQIESGFESYAYVAYVDAPNASKAKALALRDPEFKSWRYTHDTNPFKGLKVTRPVCKHGECWCPLCHPDGCELCIAEMTAMACCFCGYVEPNGNLLLACGKHFMCDDCLLAGEAIDHECTEKDKETL